MQAAGQDKPLQTTWNSYPAEALQRWEDCPLNNGAVQLLSSEQLLRPYGYYLINLHNTLGR